MYRAILCDDNEIILEGLKTQVQWQKLGIELSATAVNGQEALSLIQRYKPDILITDIRMPYIDGLELSRKARMLNPQIVILIISAYDDFEYARSAIHLGALDYILKPINIDSLNQLLATAADTCKKQHHDQHTIITNIFKSLLIPSNRTAEALALLDENGVMLDQYCCVMLAELNQNRTMGLSEEIKYSIARKFSGIGKDNIADNVYQLEVTDTQYLFLLTSVSRLQLSILRTELFQRIRGLFPANHDYTDVSIAAGNFYLGLDHISRSYADAKEAMKLHFIKGSNADLLYEEIAVYASNEKAKQIAAQMDSGIDLIPALKAGNRDAVNLRLNDLRQWLLQKGSDSYLYMTVSIGSFYNNLSRELEESGINIRELFDDPVSEFSKITSSGTLDSCIENLRTSLYQICDYITKNQSKYGKIISEALAYMQTHYQDSNLNIDVVANAIGLSPSYFSTIFRSEAGITFTDYLIRLRMEKAKTLLENGNMKIYEISQQVGYENAAYFSAAFKKYFGKSPSLFTSESTPAARPDQR
ncbi:MAG: response regulator [Lachnospiraceae bacterium]|nr:response regulator [Lachnospiraceae bacterium]